MLPEEIQKQFAPWAVSSMMKDAGFKGPCIGVVWTDDMVFVGQPEFVDIMMRKDSSCIPAALWSQAIQFCKEKGVLIQETRDGWNVFANADTVVPDFFEHRIQAVIFAFDIIDPTETK